LFAPDGMAVQSAVTFGPQLQNISQGRFPDGDATAIYFMGRFTPRSANTLPPLHFTGISVWNGLAVLDWEAIPAMTYRLQYKTNLSDAAWVDIAPDVVASGKSIRCTNTLRTSSPRCYRVWQMGN